MINYELMIILTRFKIILNLIIGFILISLGLWLLFSFIKKLKIDSFYDIKGFMIGIACLIGGLFLILKSLF